jgi:NodT family efflux transporter outer membrane factor (OMF) lipoprotein
VIRARRLVTLAPLALALSACEFAPHYTVPATPPPPAFKEAAGWGPAQPADDQPRGAWWTVFGDPDLDRIEQQVTDANQDIKAAAARFDQARALAKISRTDLYPTIDARAGETSGNLSHAVTNPLPNRRYDDDVVGVEASWELDVWGRVRDTARAARDQAQASAGDLAAATLSLHAEAAADYLALRGYDAQAAVLDDTVAAYAHALELTQARFEAGYSAEPDVSAAQTALELARTKATDARLNRTRLEHAIALLAGKAPADFTLPVRIVDTQPPATAAVLPGDLLQRRPDIAAAERRVEAANYKIGAARAAFFPQISLSGLVGSEARTPSALFTGPATVWAAGAAGVLNLFDGGRRRGVDAQAHAELDEAAAHYRQAILTAYGEVEDNLAALRMLGDESGTQAAGVEAATRSRVQAERRYSAGYANYYDVITAQNIELAAKLDLVRIQFLRMNADVLLIKALGGGWRSADLPVAHPASNDTAQSK